MNDLENYCRIARQEVDRVLNAVNSQDYQTAAQLIWDAQTQNGRLHVTGIGKPGHVAAYAASLLSSVGIPTYFLHGTEAVHGSCGQLEKGDVVLCISNSGETDELKSTSMAIRNNGGKIIALTGNGESWLAHFADVSLVAGVEQEGGPLNRAPRTSILAECIAVQALSIVLQEHRKLTPQEYVMRHPGGSLGKLREGETGR